MHYFRYGKGQAAQVRREQNFAEASRLRSDARSARLQREKDEKAAKRRKVRETHKPAETTPPPTSAEHKE